MSEASAVYQAPSTRASAMTMESRSVLGIMLAVDFRESRVPLPGSTGRLGFSGASWAHTNTSSLSQHRVA